MKMTEVKLAFLILCLPGESGTVHLTCLFLLSSTTFPLVCFPVLEKFLHGYLQINVFESIVFVEILS